MCKKILRTINLVDESTYYIPLLRMVLRPQRGHLWAAARNNHVESCTHVNVMR